MKEFSNEELIAGIRQAGIVILVIAPVFCGTAATGMTLLAPLQELEDLYAIAR